MYAVVITKLVTLGTYVRECLYTRVIHVPSFSTLSKVVILHRCSLSYEWMI